MQSTIAFENYRSAALYFDKVLPVSFVESYNVKEYAELVEGTSMANLLSIVFDRPIKKGSSSYDSTLRDFLLAWNELIGLVNQHLLDHVIKPGDPWTIEIIDSELKAGVIKNSEIRNYFNAYSHRLGLNTPNVILPTATRVSTDTSEPIVTLEGLQLIDCSAASWTQIMELRADTESRKKLQRLRAFFTEKYADKNIAYIEDDLSQRLYEYEQTRKKHGFALIAGTVSSLLESKDLLGMVGASMAAGLVGGSVVGLSVAAIVGAGKVALKFAESKNTMEDWRDSHPFAYVIETKAKIRPNTINMPPVLLGS